MRKDWDSCLFFFWGGGGGGVSGFWVSGFRVSRVLGFMVWEWPFLGCSCGSGLRVLGCWEDLLDTVAENARIKMNSTRTPKP